MYHFFAEPSQIGEDEIRLTGTDVKHLQHVLRMQPGEQISVTDSVSGKEYRCEIKAYADGSVQLKIMWAEEACRELPARITLFQGLPKGDKMELIIQKAVELGAVAIVPVAAKRSVVRLDEKKAAAKQKRWQAIAESAAKQSRRNVIPQIHEVINFAEAAALAGQADVAIIPYERAKGIENTRQQIAKITPGKSVAVLIGPEGGFEESEIQMAENQGICPVTLGKRILRTETAGLAVLSVLMFHLESAQAETDIHEE